MKANNHLEWEGRVDGTWFGLMAGYLRSPRSPIEYLVHVKDRERLAEVADRIDRDLAQGGGQAGHLTHSVEALVCEGAAKVSSRHPVANLDPDAVVDPERIRSSASCDVLYLPPYYVVHTPGLFEGELTMEERGRKAQSAAPTAPSREQTAGISKDEGPEHYH